MEVGSHGEDWGWLCEDSLKGASAPQLAGRESGKMSGPAGEARKHCLGVHEERGFLLCVPTDNRAPPKQTPETGANCGYHLGPQRQAWTATAAASATKDPVCNCRSLPTPSQEPLQPTTAEGPMIRANTWRTHRAPQAAATSRQPLPPQVCPTFQL